MSRRFVPRLRRWFTFPADAGPLALVALVWLVQTYLLIGFVTLLGSNLPHYDEWEMIPALLGKQKITLTWLWSQHNEHRIFLPRLVYLLVERVGGLDFRAAMYFDVALLSLMAALCCRVARRLRGATSYSDAFFPLLLLHWGQAQNLFWSFQIVFVMSAALSIIALLLLLKRVAPSYPVAVGVGACAVALPLTGGTGLALVPALGCCTLLYGFELWRSRPRRVYAWLSVSLLGLLSFAALGFYFVNYERPAKHPISPTLEATLKGTLQVLTNAFGSGLEPYWIMGSGKLIFGISLLTVVALVVQLIGARWERIRVLRLGLFMLGMLCLSAGIAWARIAVYPDGLFQSRYVTPVAPYLCGLYFSWVLFKRARIAPVMQMSLMLVSAILVLPNHERGYQEGLDFRGSREKIIAEIQEGIPPKEIARLHCSEMYYVCDTTALADRLTMLHDVGGGPFARPRK